MRLHRAAIAALITVTLLSSAEQVFAQRGGGGPGGGGPGRGDAGPGGPGRGDGGRGGPERGGPGRGDMNPGGPGRGGPNRGEVTPGGPGRGGPNRGDAGVAAPGRGGPNRGDATPGGPGRGEAGRGGPNRGDAGPGFVRPGGGPPQNFNRGQSNNQQRFYPPNNPGPDRQSWMQDRRNYWQNGLNGLRSNPSQVRQQWQQQHNQWRNNVNNSNYRNQYYGNRGGFGNNWGLGGTPFGAFGYFGGVNSPYGYYGGNRPYMGAQNYYGNWYQGRWGGPLLGNNWNGYWNNQFSRYPVATALGLSSWALNGGQYAFGLGNYNNPFYATGGLGYVNYNQPFLADTTSYSSSYAATDSTGATSQDPAMVAFGEARADFRNDNYDGALRSVNKALETAPRDPVLNEFRSLVLFAQGDYPRSAEALHPVLALGPGWDWATLIGLYPNVNTYTDQLRALEKYRNNNPSAQDGRFLLGYHYMTAGHKAAAATEFKQYNELVKNDPVGKDLFTLVSANEESEKDSKLEEAMKAAVKAVTPSTELKSDQLVGTWKAEGKDSKSYTIDLKKDGDFQWTFKGNDQDKTLEGVYVVDKDTLILEPKSGGALLAKIDLKDDKTMSFNPIGDAAGQEEITFARQ